MEVQYEIAGKTANTNKRAVSKLRRDNLPYRIAMNRFNKCIVGVSYGICQYYDEPIQKNVI
jgi:hypothetical protein|tara:strand:+ start:27559 stop:27741 length:183 start_codon:yes stop_codon:yes gene_type:complete